MEEQNFPAAASILGLIRRRRVHAVGLIVLVATAAGILGGLLFISPFLLLVKAR